MSWDWISTLHHLKKNATPAALVTIIKAKGSTPRDVGTKMVVTEKDFFGTIGGGQLEDLVLRDAREILKNSSRPERLPYPLCLKAHQCCGGFVEVLVETVHTEPQLLIFGAGHVAQAVARTLEGTPFQVHLIDPRPEWLEKAPDYVTRHENEGLHFIAGYSQWSPERTYAVVMTFDHDLDQKLIENLVQQKTRYLGLIGSRMKWQRFEKRLLEKGLPAEDLKKVRCPIGLPLGGKSPAEVAISFAAEIVQIQNEVLKNSSSSPRAVHTAAEDFQWEDVL